MRLKSLKLAGFKSFAHPTTFTFHHNITAIVGPNGCGKSNVIDAIRWVLGETSAKQLRGGSMSDVIFAGTQHHAAKSMASVELTFEHTQDETTGIRHELNLYHELSVRRQVNKDGKSDYFINGTKARRRDVVDIFLGTGLGSGCYAVIEQGMIGRIVDSSPKQLREFIEEAAGVSRYQARREETHKKLQKAQENLDRLNDLQCELQKQHKTLSHQAKTAQKYQAIKNEMSQIEGQLAIAQLYAAKQNEQTLTKQYQTLSHQAKQQQDVLATLSQKVDKLNEHIAEQQWLKDDKRNTLHEQQMQEQQTKHQHQTLLDKQNQLSNNIEQHHHRQQHLTNTLAKLTVERQQKQQQLEAIDPTQSKHQQQITELKNQLAPLKQAWQDAQHAHEQEQQKLNDVDKQLAVNEQALKQLSHTKSKWQQQHHQWQQSWQALTTPTTLKILGIPKEALTLNNQDNQDKDDQDNSDTAQTHLLDLLKQKIDKQHTLISRYEQQLDELEIKYQQAQHEQQQHTRQLTEQHQVLISLEKRHAMLDSEYHTLYALLHPKPILHSDKPNHIQSSAKKQTSPKTAGHHDISTLWHHWQQRSSHQQLGQCVELTELGLEHADGLDQWLALWLDAIVLNLPNALTHTVPQPSINNLDMQILATLISQSNPNSQMTALLNTQPTQQKNLAQVDGINGANDTQNDIQIATKANTLATHDKKSKLLTTLADAHQLPLWAIDTLIKTPTLTALSGWYYCCIGEQPHREQHENLQTSTTNTIITLLSQILSSNQPFTLCTDTGWLIGQFGIIHLSKLGQDGRGGHFLKERHAQRQRLAQLEKMLTDIQSDINQQTKIHKQFTSRHKDGQITLEEWTAQLANLKTDHMQVKNDLAMWQGEQRRLQNDHRRLNQEKNQLDADFTEQQQHQAQLDAKNIELTQQRHRHLTAIKQLDNTRQQLQTQKDHLHTTLNELTQAQQQASLAKQQLVMQLEHLHEQSKQLHTQSEHTNKRIHQQQSEQHQLKQQLVKLDALLTKQQSDIAHSKIELEEHQHQLTEQQRQYQSLKDASTHAQQQLNDSNAYLTTCTTELAIAKERLNDATTRVDEHANLLNTGVSASSLLADFIAHNRKIDNADNHAKQQRLQQDYQSLQIQLGRLGAVNMAAKAELDAITERLTPLTKQTDDILASIDTLTDAISTIDDKTKQLFLQTLTAVNDDLNNLFANMFGGGQASLSLVNEDGLSASNAWRAGLELMAQPKGKRNSRLAVLSGGEKTLTALSLIFAIFKQHPAPFCVLDEVDAPLDDANVERFTSLINEMAHEVQFIFISHNKLSMQIANELKGITMPNAGISTLVNVNLDEAEHHLAYEL